MEAKEVRQYVEGELKQAGVTLTNQKALELLITSVEMRPVWARLKKHDESSGASCDLSVGCSSGASLEDGVTTPDQPPGAPDEPA